VKARLFIQLRTRARENGLNPSPARADLQIRPGRASGSRGCSEGAGHDRLADQARAHHRQLRAGRGCG
jgi:hypothetical protein